MLSICWLLFLHSAVQLNQTFSIGLRLGDCGGQVIWCSTPSLSLVT
jgi:hypothetical protein